MNRGAGGTFEQNSENFSEDCERHFIHRRWYYAEGAQYIAYMTRVSIKKFSHIFT